MLYSSSLGGLRNTKRLNENSEVRNRGRGGLPLAERLAEAVRPNVSKQQFNARAKGVTARRFAPSSLPRSRCLCSCFPTCQTHVCVCMCVCVCVRPPRTTPSSLTRRFMEICRFFFLCCLLDANIFPTSTTGLVYERGGSRIFYSPVIAQHLERQKYLLTC